MNLLLVEPGEVAADGTITLADRRADHLRRIIGAAVGDSVRAGVLAGRVGKATVLSDDGANMTLALELLDLAPPPMPVELVLAVPRPKVLTRTIEAAAAFGVLRIDLTNAWRVDKSYLASPRLLPDPLAYALRFGAEQGGNTHLPPLKIHDRLMSFLDERFPSATTGAPATRLIAHPGAPPIETATLSWPLAIAIGPEGGWIQRELDTFVERGFVPVSFGQPILRVEQALAVALGQLLLLRRTHERQLPR
ncbi:MAG: 16S rRNA (uracil(1498)-N(3))-methyltransferase [Kofleriaceae bacterium]